MAMIPRKTMKEKKMQTVPQRARKWRKPRNWMTTCGFEDEQQKPEHHQTIADR
jgi:hypothetical protein